MTAHFAGLGISIERVMTDNAWCYTHSPNVQRVLVDLGVRHLTIRPHRPQTNGKAERFNRTLLEEWAYTKLYRSNQAGLADLPKFLDFYNRRRPHTALGGRSPIDRVSYRRSPIHWRAEGPLEARASGPCACPLS